MSQSVMQVNQEKFSTSNEKTPDAIFTKLFGQEYLKAQKDKFEGTFNQYLFYRDYT